MTQMRMRAAAPMQIKTMRALPSAAVIALPPVDPRWVMRNDKVWMHNRRATINLTAIRINFIHLNEINHVSCHFLILTTVENK